MLRATIVNKVCLHPNSYGKVIDLNFDETTDILKLFLQLCYINEEIILLIQDH